MSISVSSVDPLPPRCNGSDGGSGGVSLISSQACTPRWGALSLVCTDSSFDDP